MDENPQQNDATPQEPENNGAPKSDLSGIAPESNNPEIAAKVESAADSSTPLPDAKKKLPKKSSFVDFVICLATAVAIALLLRAFIFQPFKIPTNSMHPTLVGNYAHGDRILVNLLTYKLSEPQRWDVFVFKCPAEGIDPDKVDYIKRLVGLPGDILNIKNGDIYVNKKIARKPRQVQDGIWIKEFEETFNQAFADNAYKYWRFDQPDKWAFKNGTVVASSSQARTAVSYNRIINSENNLFPESNITDTIPVRYLRITKSTKVTCPFCKHVFAPEEWEIKRPEKTNRNMPDDFYLRCHNPKCGQSMSLKIDQASTPAKLLIYGNDKNKPSVEENIGSITGLNDEPQQSRSSALDKSSVIEFVGDIKSKLDFKFLEKNTITFIQVEVNRTNYTLFLSPDYPLNDITRNYLMIKDGGQTKKHKLNSDRILKVGTSVVASLENYDHSINVVIDGEVVYQYQYQDDLDLTAEDYIENGVSFGIDNGKASFNLWTISKDIYYHDKSYTYGDNSENIDLTANSDTPKLRNRYFAMGDNSALSSDSRVWGGVPKANIIGKAILVLWPPKHVKMIR